MSVSPHQHAGQPAPVWDSATTPRFQTLKFLGKGGQGFVQLAYDNLHQQRVAIKYIDRGWSRGFYKYVLRETLNHQQLSLCKHPHIVEFHEVFLTPSYLAVVMEYVNGTNLQHYLEAAGGKLPEDVARFIFQQLIIAVDFCHRKGKVNRDIKLANILLQEGHLPLVKLCDFGFSKDKFDDSEPQTQIGTALFTAPEIFTNVPGQVYDAEAADVWSCGVVLFVMLFGCHPFLSLEDTQHRKHAQVMKLIENAVRGNVQVPSGAEELYPQALDLVRRILVSAPGQRYKLPAIMAHPWFQDKLPPGALMLNAAYLAMENPVGELRQTPEEVHAIITAALSVSVQEQDKSESTSATPGAAGEVTSASEASRSFHAQQHQPTPRSHMQAVVTQVSHQSMAPAPPPGVHAGTPTAAGTPQGAHYCLSAGSLPGHRQHSALGNMIPPGRPPQHMPGPGQPGPQPRFPEHIHPIAHVGGGGMAPGPVLQMLGMDLGGQQPGSAHVSSSSLGVVAVGGSGGPGHASNTGMQYETPQAMGPGMAPDIAQQTLRHPAPAPSHVTAQQTLVPAGSPMAVPADASIAVSSGNAGSFAGPVVSGLNGNAPDVAEVASESTAVAVGPHAGPRGPNAMDVSGCILYDSSLLYKLDLQAED